tara:strand:- start:1539 stop:1853 length:315 start_codon:yes stop_codon:yes gene_type:complete
MSPQNSNGSNLSVSTRMGNKVLKDEELMTESYSQNQQREPKSTPSCKEPGFAEPYGHETQAFLLKLRDSGQLHLPTDDAELMKASNKDLAKRGLKTNKISTDKK